MTRLAFVFAAAIFAVAPARAGEAADVAAEHLYAGRLEAGEERLRALADAAPDDAEAKAALGTVRFARAIERFAQAMYRHGFDPGGRGGFGPLLRMPMPVNPSPETLDYEGLRTIFATLSTDLDAAEATLAEVGDRPVELVLAPGRIRLDIDGDGTAAEGETLLSLAFGDDAPPELREANERFVVAFDTADVYWLRGYAHLLGSAADFWLAFEFRETFDLTFQAIFPRAGLPNAEALTTGSSVAGLEADDIADVVALIHLIDWPVADRARLERVRTRWLAVAELNRKTWAAAQAETDDDREWLPAPKQRNSVMAGAMGLEVTQERLDAWLAAVAEVEDVLEGRKLLPHWRFAKGVDLRRAFAEAERFDLVLWVAGQGVLPFLADGPVADGESLAAAERAFGGDLLTYAFWFN